MRYICKNKECTAYCNLNIICTQDRPLYCPITAERVKFKNFDEFDCDEDYCEAEDKGLKQLKTAHIFGIIK